MRDQQRQGFTLIEIMAVVIIMGLLAGGVGIAIFNNLDTARVNAARSQISSLEGALELYRMDNARYPTSDQGLNALVRKPSSPPEPRNFPPAGYLQKQAVPLDPWGEKYQYRSPGERNPHGFDLWSLGADSQPGGDGNDADIGNWIEDGFQDS